MAADAETAARGSLSWLLTVTIGHVPYPPHAPKIPRLRRRFTATAARTITLAARDQGRSACPPLTWKAEKRVTDGRDAAEEAFQERSTEEILAAFREWTTRTVPYPSRQSILVLAHGEGQAVSDPLP